MYILKKYILYAISVRPVRLFAVIRTNSAAPQTVCSVTAAGTVLSTKFPFAVIQTVLSGRFEVCLNLIEYNNSAGILPHNYESTEQSRENT